MSIVNQTGALRVPLALEEPISTDDQGGGFYESWVSLGAVWAKVQPANALDSKRAEHFAGQISHRITVRRDPQQPIKSGMRFVTALRIFRILAVYDPDERGALLMCLAEEVER
ncbi:MAG: phage head closure protein [Hyphomicrobiales bacterium]